MRLRIRSHNTSPKSEYLLVKTMSNTSKVPQLNDNPYRYNVTENKPNK